MRARRVLLALLLCSFLLVFGWLIWMRASGDIAYRPLTPPAATGSTPVGHGWFGAVHVHSELSGDATGTIEEIVAAASEVGLDFVVLSEHTRALGNRGRQQGGWYGDVLVVIGEEISTTGGHVLALGVPPHPYALGPTPKQALADIAELGGRAIIAHPARGGETGWPGSWTGADGAEVVNFSSALLRASEAGLLRAMLSYPINPLAATARVLRAPSPAIDEWDRRVSLGADGVPRRLAGGAGVDAHGPLVLGMPSYATAFASLQTLIWLPEEPRPGSGNERIQAARIVEALAEGRSAVVVAAVGTRPAFSYHAEGTGGRVVPPGAFAPWEEAAWTLRAELLGDGPWETLLRRDGVEIARELGGTLEHLVTEPGTYRVEVRRADAGLPPGAPPWILANPIYVWPTAAITASRVRPVPPLPPPPLTDDLLELPGWAAQGDERSRSALAPAGQGLTWDLRLAPVEENDRFAALAWRPEGGATWTDRRGIGAAVRSEERWRIGLRVWTREDDGGEATWERVFAADEEGRPTAAVWSEFRRLGSDGENLAGGTDDGGLAARLDRILGVALVVTPQRMRPGTETRIEVLRLGLF